MAAPASWICVEPLLAEPWILDVDTTIKPLYGHQEGAVLGYNPKKPGRPSHCYHTYSMASTRLVLDVDVCPATSMHPSIARRAYGRRSIACRATCGRRCCAETSASATRGSCARPSRGLPYLFKLRLTANVKRMIEKLAGAREWVCAGQGFEAKESAVRLTGWSRERRVIVLRRRLKGALGLAQSDEDGTPQLSFTEIGEATESTIIRFWSPRRGRN